jgi:hypothetical protein
MPSDARFDPRDHARRLENGADYLDVKWRIAWLRAEHPDALIETELLAVDEERALCKAIVRLPTGGSASAHASATRGGGSAVEQAESRAIGRALAALGYGAEYSDDDIVPGRTVERPMSLVPSSPVRQLREPEPEEQWATPEPAPLAGVEPVERSARPERVAPIERADEPEPVPIESGTAQPESSEQSDRVAAPIVAEAGEATSAADISWTRFWEWAKDRGYRDRNHLKDLLGVDVMSMSPRDVRKLIIRYEVEHPPPGREE